MDGEFEKVKGLMPTVECNTTTAKEHVSKAECSIRMVKERMQRIMTMLPFTHIPRHKKDRVHVLHSTLAECFPGEDRDIKYIFAARDISTLAA